MKHEKNWARATSLLPSTFGALSTRSVVVEIGIDAACLPLSIEQKLSWKQKRNKEEVKSFFYLQAMELIK